MTCVASIDIGTNTVRLLILETKPDGNLREVVQVRAITRLGKGWIQRKNYWVIGWMKLFLCLPSFGMNAASLNL